MTPPINVIDILQPENASAASPDDAKISEFEDVASYNWLDEPNPTILVPGEFSSRSDKRVVLLTDRDFGTRYPSDVEPTRRRSAPQA